MEPIELAKLQLEAWKTTIQVQQHFNDIEMKIRSLAITVLTAVLAAVAVAIKDGTKLHVIGVTVPLGSALLFVGLVTWWLFYFVDKIWYHRLLLGAVKHGKVLEDALGALGPGFALTKTIGDESPYQFKLPLVGDVGQPVHSSKKLSIFYWVVGMLLFLATLLSAFGTGDASKAKHKNERSTIPESAWRVSAGPSPRAKVGKHSAAATRPKNKRSRL